MLQENVLEDSSENSRVLSQKICGNAVNHHQEKLNKIEEENPNVKYATAASLPLVTSSEVNLVS